MNDQDVIRIEATIGEQLNAALLELRTRDAQSIEEWKTIRDRLRRCIRLIEDLRGATSLIEND